MKLFFFLWQLCPSGSWAWRWCSCLACGDPGSTLCAETRTDLAIGVMVLSDPFFWASCSWQLEGLFGQSFSIAPPVQALRGPPCLGSFSVVRCVGHIEGVPLAGVLLCRPARQALPRAPREGSYSVVLHISHRKEHPGWGPTLWFSVSGVRWASLSIVQLPVLVHGGREAMVMTPHLTWDSAVLPCFHGCLAFLHWHLPPWSPPSHPLNPSLCHQQQPSPRHCSTIPKFQLPAAAPSRWPAYLSGLWMAVARTVWFSLHLGCHRSAVSLSALNVSPLTQRVALLWGLDPCFSSPTHWGQVQSY